MACAGCVPIPSAAAVLLLAVIGIADVAALPSARGSVSIPATVRPPRRSRPILAAPRPNPRVRRRWAAAAEDTAARRFTGTRRRRSERCAARRAGVPERQGREYVALLRQSHPPRGRPQRRRPVRPRRRARDDGTLGQLLYAGLDRVARADVELMKWTDGKHVIWVNADGVGGERERHRRPVSGRVTSGFGERFHPILGYARMHKGVDLAAAYGSPIVAAADGRVVSAGWHGGYGRQVAIAHGGGIQTTYGHMSRIAAYAGEAVRQGQVIGYVGSSGLSTGPHLHYEVLKNGRPVNPLSVKLGGGPGQLEGEKLHQFHDALGECCCRGGGKRNDCCRLARMDRAALGRLARKLLRPARTDGWRRDRHRLLTKLHGVHLRRCGDGGSAALRGPSARLAGF